MPDPLVSKDIRSMKRAELVEHFGSKRSGRVVMNRLMRGLILQAHAKIQAGEEAPIGGNLRTFWYRFIKPLLSRIPDDDRLKSDPYDLMLMAFSQLVLEERALNYADFDLADENWSSRLIGEKLPHVLVFAEKRGWARFLKRLNQELGVSVLALGGFPSVLTSEYTLLALRQEVAADRLVHLLALVDWDPSGRSIATSFKSQLRQLGLEKSQLHWLITPGHYSPGEINASKFVLPGGQPTKTKQWLELTGGIGGEAMGLESESMPWPRLRGLIEETLKEL